MGEERVTQRTVTVVMATIAALAFVFSFGNVWSLALRLGVPRPIAPLIAPMVDLSVVGLLVGLRYLSLRGVDAKELQGATRLMHLSGLLTLALNVAEPIAAGHYGRAAVDPVAPLLLLGWGAVGPQLLRHFHTVTTPTPAPVPVTDPPAELSGLGAIAHQSAGQYARAEQQTAQTLDLLDRRFTRNRTYYSVLLAELQLTQGDADRAAATASHVQASGVASSRIIARLERVTAAAQHRGGRP